MRGDRTDEDIFTFFLLEVYTTPTVRRIDIRAQQEQQKKSPNMAEDMFM